MSASAVIRRILGLVMLLVGLTILVLGLVGAFTVGDAIEEIATSVENGLTFAEDSLAAARETIVFTQGTLTDVSAAVDTAVQATLNVSKSVSDSRPFIANATTILAEDLPANIESLQATLPAVIDVAGVIDQTLTTLSNIGIDRTIDLPFGQSIPIQFDLGIEYSPEVPFDDSVRQLETSLQGLPENLRALEEDLTVTNDNLGVLSDDLLQASEDLETINDLLAELGLLTEEYIQLIDQLDESLRAAGNNIPAQLDTLQLGVRAGLILLALSQLASIYLGIELLRGRRENVVVVQSEPAAIGPYAATGYPSETVAGLTTVSDASESEEQPTDTTSTSS